MRAVVDPPRRVGGGPDPQPSPTVLQKAHRLLVFCPQTRQPCRFLALLQQPAGQGGVASPGAARIFSAKAEGAGQGRGPDRLRQGSATPNQHLEKRKQSSQGGRPAGPRVDSRIPEISSCRPQPAGRDWCPPLPPRPGRGTASAPLVSMATSCFPYCSSCSWRVPWHRQHGPARPADPCVLHGLAWPPPAEIPDLRKTRPAPPAAGATGAPKKHSMFHQVTFFW